MKLEIELVPETSWYNNLRKALPRSEWDKIRKEVYEKANNKCEICQQDGRLNCHEKWSYDDEKNIQKLQGFQALCDKCHNIKHIGFVNVQISSGKWSKTVSNNLFSCLSSILLLFHVYKSCCCFIILDKSSCKVRMSKFSLSYLTNSAHSD